MVGAAGFDKLWVSAPSSTTASDGLGPLYNARACQSCHLRGGRGGPPGPDETAVSLVARLSAPDPVYGHQIQPFAVQGVAPEGRLHIDWVETAVTLADGTAVHLRRPAPRVEGLAYGPLREDIVLSLRVAPPVIGIGLLEAIPEAAVLRRTAETKPDGVTGRPNWRLVGGEKRLGRLGWKAETVTAEDQTAHAFADDMGLSTRVLAAPAGDCTVAQHACLAAPDGRASLEAPEVADALFDLIVLYARAAAVPARRGRGEPAVRKGEAVFQAAGCPVCHIPSARTAADAALPELANRDIEPFTDLLLHDMGDGLADAGAGPMRRDWRTAPLWGIGLAQIVNARAGFLHDGRARTILEAILWHGGEGEAAMRRVLALSATDRAALLSFLGSL